MAAKEPEVKYLLSMSNRLAENLSTLSSADKKRSARSSTLDKYREIQHNLLESLQHINSLLAVSDTPSTAIAEQFVADDNSVPDGAELAEVLETQPRELSRKEIMRNYAGRMNELAKAEFEDKTLAILASCLSEWLISRYLSRSSNFYYSPYQIAEWIDAIIVAYADAYTTNTHYQFAADLTTWLATIKSTPTEDSTYPAPFNIRLLKDSEYRLVTQLYGVAFESVIKPYIYSDKFMPGCSDTIRRIVKEDNSFMEIPEDYNGLIQLAERYSKPIRKENS